MKERLKTLKHMSTLLLLVLWISALVLLIHRLLLEA